MLAALLTAPANDAPGAPPRTTRIAAATYLGDAPTLVAERRGYFAHHGLQARVSYASSARHNLRLLRNDEVDFALTALTPLVLDRLAHSDAPEATQPVVLASLVHSTRPNHVVALADGPIRRPRDLARRRIGLTKGTNAEFAWWVFAHYHGLDPGAARIVDRDIDALPDALVAGRIDAAVIWEPWTARLRERLGERLHSLAGASAYTAKWVLVTHPETSQEQAARCRAVLRAYRDAIAFIGREPNAARRMYAEHAGVAPDALRDSWDAALYDLNLDWSTVAALQQQLDWARRTGHQGAGQPPDVLSLLAPEALRAVAPAAVGVPGVPASTKVNEQ